MKFLQVAAVLGGAASVALASPDVPALPDVAVADAPALTTSVVYATQLHTVVHCGADVTDCPSSGTTIVTSVVAVTTTICPATETPIMSKPGPSGASTETAVVTKPGPPGASTSSHFASPSSSGSSGHMTGPVIPIPVSTMSDDIPVSGIWSGTLTDAVPTSFPVQSSALSSGGASFSYGAPSAPGSSLSSGTTNTDSVPTSFHPSSGTASASTPAGSSSVTPPSSTAIPSSPASPSYSSPVDAPSGYPSSSNPAGSPSSSGTPSSSSPAGTSSGPISVVTSPPPGSPSSSVTGGATIETSTPAVPSVPADTSGASSVPVSSAPVSLPGYGPPPALTLTSDSSVVPTSHITSSLTQTYTSVVTVPASSSQSSGASTSVEGSPTSFGTSASGASSGYPQPSNGTITVPSPTVSLQPVNGSPQLGAGKGSLVAIVIAFAFAHFA